MRLDPKLATSFEEAALYNMHLVESVIQLPRGKSVLGGDEMKKQLKNHK